MSGYRQRRDPREIALERLAEAYSLESRALVEKSEAEVELRQAEMAREIAWQSLGVRTNLLRHLGALKTALDKAHAAADRPPQPADPQRLARLEAERAAFLRARGVEPGPALTEPRAPATRDDVERRLETARAESDEAERQIRAADERIALARAGLERALDALGQATRARVDAQAEAERVSGRSGA